jgi:hypothetical protein
MASVTVTQQTAVGTCIRVINPSVFGEIITVNRTEALSFNPICLIKYMSGRIGYCSCRGLSRPCGLPLSVYQGKGLTSLTSSGLAILAAPRGVAIENTEGSTLPYGVGRYGVQVQHCFANYPAVTSWLGVYSVLL